MKNQHSFAHYSIFFSLLLFTTAFSLNVQQLLVNVLNKYGLYHAVTNVLTERYIKVSLWVILFLFFFMFFSALKLVAEMLMELSFFFFVRMLNTENKGKNAWGSRLFLIFSCISVLCFPSLPLLLLMFFLGVLSSFALALYHVSDQMKTLHMVGFVFLHFFFWGSLFSFITFILLKLFNGIIKSMGV